MSRRRRTKVPMVFGVWWLALVVVKCSTVVASGIDSSVDVTLRFTEEPEDTILVKHSQAVLNCSANSSNGSDVEISWRKSGEALGVVSDLRRIVCANGSLVIRHFSRQQGDEGFYECIAKAAGGGGTLVSRRALLQEAVLGSFSGHPGSIRVPLGGNARFECTINGIPKPSITWRKDGHPLTPSERMVQLASGVLQLVNVTLSDVGSYSCWSSSFGHEKTSRSAELTLDSGSGEVGGLLSFPRDQEVRLGHTATFECLPSLSGHSVLWSRKDGIDLPRDRSRTFGPGNLEIRDVQLSDAANYSCAVANLPNVRGEARLTLTVPPTILSSSKNGVESRAQTIRMACDFAGQPPPAITWMKNGESMSSSHRIKIQRETLVISQIMDSDSALYQCWAENSAGREGAVIPLSVKSSGKDPSPPTGLRARTIDSKTIELTWDPPPSDSQLVGYSVHSWSMQGNENQEVITQPPRRISNLLPYTNYTFFIRAYNKHGASEPSPYIVQATGEDVPLVAPEVHVFPLSATSLEIMWDKLQPSQARGAIIEHKIFYKNQDDPAREISVPGNVFNYELTNLETDEEYSVRVLTGTAVGFPKFDEDRWPWVTQTVSEPMNVGGKRVPNVEIHVLNSTTVRVTWDTPESGDSGDMGFKLNYNLIGEKPKLILLVEHIREHTLYGLKADSVYEIEIGVLTQKDDGDLYKQTIRTPPLGKPSSPTPGLTPVALDAKPINETAIQVSWQTHANDASTVIYYTVICVPTVNGHDDEKPKETLINSTGSSVVIAGLIPMTEYRIAVRGHTAIGPGPVSSPVTCHTEEGRPPALLQLTWFLQEPTVVQLNWKMPPYTNRIVSQYVVSYCEDKFASDRAWMTHIENGSLCYTVLHGLKGRTVYQVRLHAENKKGAGPASSLKVLTGIPFDEDGSSNDRLMGIIIGIGISGGCIIICIIIILLRNRCFPPPQRGSSVMMQHTNGSATPLRCNGFVAGHTDCRCDGHEPDGTTPMLTQPQEPEVTDNKIEMHSQRRVNLWSSVNNGRARSTAVV